MNLLEDYQRKWKVGTLPRKMELGWIFCETIPEDIHNFLIEKGYRQEAHSKTCYTLHDDKYKKFI
jgi:hypothetical protein